MCVYVCMHVLYFLFLQMSCVCVSQCGCLCGEDGSEAKINKEGTSIDVPSLRVAKGGRQYLMEKVEGQKYTVGEKV